VVRKLEQQTPDIEQKSGQVLKHLVSMTTFAGVIKIVSINSDIGASESHTSHGQGMGLA
jgi:hypothetical protein